MSEYMHNATAENLYPRSRDTIERDISDNGFSKGWGGHFPPVEDYWFDIHTHIHERLENVSDSIGGHFAAIGDRNIQKLGIIPFATVVKGESTSDSDLFSLFTTKKELLKYFAEIVKSDRCLPILYLHYTNPDLELIQAAAETGIHGIKLHNACVIMDGSDHKIYLSEQWDRAFNLMGKLKLPIIWHVTQRLTASGYTKSGANSYWKIGWTKGTACTNEDLLQVYLKVVERHRDVAFVSAHQLHLGWDRLSGLLDLHPNLYTDTTVGCFIRKDDTICEPERNYLRDIFIRYNDRILFGTDIYIKKAIEPAYLDFFIDGHIRFIKQLRLPDNVLQRIAYGNAERLLAK